MKKYIKGTYKRSIFESEKGYIIGILKLKETSEEEASFSIGKTITFTGYFAELNEDDDYIFYGELIEHPKYGLQFSVTESERVKPEDIDGIIAFLSSDLFPGIGEKMAKQIVHVLGELTLNRILEEPECLNLVPKLSMKKQQQIVDTLHKYEESHNTIVYLTELGFSMKDALSIYNYYKSNTIIEIEHNIYQVIDDIPELHFLKIDSIAQKLKIDMSDERRIQAGIFYICNRITFETGDTYFKKEDIKHSCSRYLQISFNDQELNHILSILCDEEKLIVVGDHYYLKNLYDAEQNITSRLFALQRLPQISYPKFKTQLNDLEKELNITYNEDQKKAIKMSLQSHVTIITGGPGVGKTTIIEAIVTMYQRLHQLDHEELCSKIALLAPTGRASKRMSESTLFPASTIHRFLKWNKDNNEFAVNSSSPDFSELIIVDEVSMIDLELFHHLLNGLTRNIQLVLVGDANQLPSVAAGQLLKDLLESEVLPSISLERLYRQSEDSYIPVLAEEIRKNELNPNYLNPTNDFTFLTCPQDQIAPALAHLCKQLLTKEYDYKRVQIMAPMYAGMIGIDALNQQLQTIFNPEDPNKLEIRYGDVIFREQDKVLQLVNMPDENVFNGDIGIISYMIPAERSKSHKNEIYVDFDGFVVKYLPKDLVNLKHAFVISIHKSQGSEFEMVILPIGMSYTRMLYRKLIYTGVTRAKRKLILIGEPNAFELAISNNHERNRNTTLQENMRINFQN